MIYLKIFYELNVAVTHAYDYSQQYDLHNNIMIYLNLIVIKTVQNIQYKVNPYFNLKLILGRYYNKTINKTINKTRY